MSYARRCCCNAGCSSVTKMTATLFGFSSGFSVSSYSVWDSSAGANDACRWVASARVLSLNLDGQYLLPLVRYGIFSNRNPFCAWTYQSPVGMYGEVLLYSVDGIPPVGSLDNIFSGNPIQTIYPITNFTVDVVYSGTTLLATVFAGTDQISFHPAQISAFSCSLPQVITITQGISAGANNQAYAYEAPYPTIQSAFRLPLTTPAGTVLLNAA